MRRMAALVLLAVTAPGCLPADDRPEPGSVLVNVRRSDVAIEGFVTDDGWSITFDRFVTAIGDMRLDGDDCVDYSLADYDRLSDFTVADTAKASLHYGLGQCTILFGIGPPADNAILMAGVTEADRELMRTEDPNATEEPWHTMQSICGPASAWLLCPSVSLICIRATGLDRWQALQPPAWTLPCGVLAPSFPNQPRACCLAACHKRTSWHSSQPSFSCPPRWTCSLAAA